MFGIENHCRETGFSKAESMRARRSITRRQGGPEPLVGVEQSLRLLSEGASPSRSPCRNGSGHGESEANALALPPDLLR
jgi:hypothetical protein